MEQFSDDWETKKGLRVCVLGPAKSGKSAIISKLRGEEFSETPDSAVFVTYLVEPLIYGNEFPLELQDLSRCDDYPTMHDFAIKKADLLLVVFSLACFESCEKCVKLSLELIAKYKRTPFIIVGNKSDLFQGEQRNLLTIENFMRNSVGKTYVEMSAKFDTSDQLLKRIYEEMQVAVGPTRVKKVFKRQSVMDMMTKLSKR